MAVLVLAALTAIVLVSGSADRRREFLERLPLTLPVLAACALVALSFGHFPPAFAAAPGTLLAVTMPALVGVLASSRWPPLVRAGLALGVAASAGIYFVASGLSGALLGSSVWPAVLQEVAGHPLLGIGIGQLEPALLATNQGLGSGLTARSEYLQTAAEAGLVGLAGLLLLIVVAALAGIRSPGPARWALLGAVAVLILVMTVQSVMSAAPGIAASLALFGLALGDFTVRNSEPGGGSRLFSA
jgi:O-antigen ligase